MWGFAVRFAPAAAAASTNGDGANDAINEVPPCYVMLYTFVGLLLPVRSFVRSTCICTIYISICIFCMCLCFNACTYRKSHTKELHSLSGAFVRLYSLIRAYRQDRCRCDKHNMVILLWGSIPQRDTNTAYIYIVASHL